MIEKKKLYDVKLEIVNSIVPIIATTPEKLIGKTIKLDLTKILKGKGSEGTFLIQKENDQLIGKIIAYKLFPSYVVRLIGVGGDIVEDSFLIKIKDYNLRIKPFLITRKKVNRSVRNALRIEMKNFLTKILADKEKEKIFQAIFTNMLQKKLVKRLKKIYPLAICELRVVKIEK